MRRPLAPLVALLALVVSAPLVAAGGEAESQPFEAAAFRGLTLRSIGPAHSSGRIADIAIHPSDTSTWFVAAGSGGVWKTTDAGTTWTPIFDDQGSYSIGCLAIDPNRPSTVWVGTGENVSGRHVGWGDGIYRSDDGGATWRHLGLADTEHLGEISIDPRDGERVLVAAEGPLWSSGGERGVYQTLDGGETWTRVLDVDDDSGATALSRDPSNPDVVYAATYQRRRHVWGFLAGGPGSGIWKSTDAGATWRQLGGGLPKGDLGKIDVVVSPVDSSVVYATIEADRKARGFYRSTDGGERWQKRSGYLSGGTGPHYYQELIASPHDVDRVYQMDVWMHFTDDGGANFQRVGGKDKHSDNHALWIDPDDPEHLIAGTDGGIYETFNHGGSWSYTENLPLTQFYKMAVDNAEPFYHVMGGTQDNGTLHGPSRTAHVSGIRNQDWTVPISADGYACQIDPEDPNTIYGEWQRGGLERVDRRTGEALDIRPFPAADEPAERWNWDSPLLISPHHPHRLWYGSQRLWRSDDRGNSWVAVSADLTRGQFRHDMPFYGRIWSVSSLWDHGAMSVYATTTTVTESPRVEGLLYVGTDDGLVQVSDDGGATWRRAGAFPGVPEWVFVNELKASPHDDDTVFAVLDAHKLGDFRPLVFRSDDRGATWTSIAGNLPERHVSWSIVQDPVRADLLYLGTDYGLFASLDAGTHWFRLEGGVPTIGFRDIELQAREGDLVGSTFGRGFYILDDVTPLRETDAATLAAGATLFTPRRAWLYVEAKPLGLRGRGMQGSDHYLASNPPFGAVFTYHLAKDVVDSLKTARDRRRDAEKALRKDGKDVPFPGWEALTAERAEDAPTVMLVVRDADGNVVRRLPAPARQGFQRVAWDLRWPSPEPIDLDPPGWRPPWDGGDIRPLASPGRYSVELGFFADRGTWTTLAEARPFDVEPLPGGTTDGADWAAIATFQQHTAELMRRALAAREALGEAADRIAHVRRAALDTPGVDTEAMLGRIAEVERGLRAVNLRLQGDQVKRSLVEPRPAWILGRLQWVIRGHWDTTHGPTESHRQSIAIVETGLGEVSTELARWIDVDLAAIETALDGAGASWTPGRRFDQ
ncbi:MAG: glycosyl hydrolase [Acidobacteriota bacterium]